MEHPVPYHVLWNTLYHIMFSGTPCTLSCFVEHPVPYHVLWNTLYLIVLKRHKNLVGCSGQDIPRLVPQCLLYKGEKDLVGLFSLLNRIEIVKSITIELQK